MPAAEFDGLALVRAVDERAADQLARTQRAFNLYCLRMPARLAVVLLNELLRTQLDRLDVEAKRAELRKRRIGK